MNKLSSFLGGEPVRTSEYTIIDLGSLGGAINVAYGVNASYSVAGQSGTASGERHAFLYKGGRINDLGTGGGQHSIALDLNDASILVGYINQGGSLAPTQAFVYEAGTMRLLPGLPWSQFSTASAVNKHGVIVGASGSLIGSEAVLWADKGQKIKGLGGLKNGKGSNAEDINDEGIVVGVSSVPGAQFGHAFLYVSDLMNDLGTLGGDSSYAWGINNRRQVVGSADTRADKRHACLWEARKARDLGVLPNDTPQAESEAMDINDAGQVVGKSGELFVGENGAKSRAFLWRFGKMYDLNRLIPPKSGWILTVALAIANNGAIVGAGTLNGKEHAFLLRKA